MIEKTCKIRKENTNKEREKECCDGEGLPRAQRPPEEEFGSPREAKEGRSRNGEGWPWEAGGDKDVLESCRGKEKGQTPLEL